MRISLTIIMLFLALTSVAQEDAWVFEHNMNDSSQHYVFGDTVYVRSTGSPKGSIVDTLYAGHELLLIKKTETNSTVRGFAAPWVSVSYKKNGVPRKGFVWSGLLSFNPMRRGAIKFVFGFERGLKDSRGEYFNGLLKVIENGKETARKAFKIYSGESLAFIEGKILEPAGLENVKYIVDLWFTGEACGVDAYDYSFAWTGTKLVSMPLCTSNADADIYWHHEAFILPKNKGGIAKTLIVDVETGEQTEQKNKTGDFLYAIEGEKQYYSWDGKTFILLKTVPKKKQLTTNTE